MSLGVFMTIRRKLSVGKQIVRLIVRSGFLLIMDVRSPPRLP